MTTRTMDIIGHENIMLFTKKSGLHKHTGVQLTEQADIITGNSE